MRGRLLSWTVVRRPPPGVEPGRVVCLVEAGGRRLLADAASEEGLALDAEVEVAPGDPPRLIRA